MLEFKGIKTCDEDWDNLPNVVAHSLIHFEKYIRGLTKVCCALTERETTSDLRRHLEEKIREQSEVTNFMREQDLYEMELIKRTSHGLQKQLDMSRESFEAFLEKVTLIGDVRLQFSEKMKDLLNREEKLEFDSFGQNVTFNA